MMDSDLKKSAPKPDTEKQAGPPAAVLRRTREELRAAKSKLSDANNTIKAASELVQHYKQLLAMKDQQIASKDKQISAMMARLDVFETPLSRLGQYVAPEPKTVPFGLLAGLGFTDPNKS